MTKNRTRLDVPDLKPLRAELRALDKRLPAQLNAELRRVAEPIRAEAARLAPRSGRNRAGRQRVLRNIKRTSLVTYATEANQHVGDTLKVGVRGTRLTVYSTRSGAGVIHWGGRHPLFGDRDYWYAQKPQPFIQKAAEKYVDRVEKDIADVVEQVWNGVRG